MSVFEHFFSILLFLFTVRMIILTILSAKVTTPRQPFVKVELNSLKCWQRNREESVFHTNITYKQFNVCVETCFGSFALFCSKESPDTSSNSKNHLCGKWNAVGLATFAIVSLSPSCLLLHLTVHNVYLLRCVTLVHLQGKHL